MKEAVEWQLGDMRAEIADLDAGHVISHEKVSTSPKSWGKSGESNAPK